MQAEDDEDQEIYETYRQALLDTTKVLDVKF